LVRPHGASGALAETNAALAAHLNLQNFLTGAGVRHHGHVAVLQISRLIRPHTGIPHEQHVSGM